MIRIRTLARIRMAKKHTDPEHSFPTKLERLTQMSNTEIAMHVFNSEVRYIFLSTHVLFLTRFSKIISMTFLSFHVAGDVQHTTMN
jgi:hypothetical protein